MDTQLFLKINSFAKQTSWAHGVLREYAVFVGLTLLAAALLVALARAILEGRGEDIDRRIATLIWTGAGAAIAFAINQPLSHAIDRARPFVALRGVEVLIAKAGDAGFPSDHATIAGAVIAGLWLARDRVIAIVATVVGVLLAFARVYVGAHYPSDVLAGLALGAVVVIAGYFVVVGPLARMIGSLVRGRESSGAQPIHRPEVLGPAVDPTDLGSTGSVRVLSDHPIVPLSGKATDDGRPRSDVGNS